MKKYADYYYTTNKTDKGYSWKMFNQYKNGEVLETSEEFFETKGMAEIDVEEHIQEYYR